MNYHHTPSFGNLLSPMYNMLAENYTIRYKEDGLEMTVKLPGLEPEDVTARYSEEDQAIYIVAEKKEYTHYLNKRIDNEKIKADLKLGILTLTAPYKDTSTNIQIE